MMWLRRSTLVHWPEKVDHWSVPDFVDSDLGCQIG
jgi:hypothetical protein